MLELNGTITAEWPPKDYTGFVRTSGREQPFAYFVNGTIITYARTSKAAMDKAKPQRFTT